MFGNPLEVIPLKRSSQEFYLLQRIQDEVHRFAITFHRQLRGKSAFQSFSMMLRGLVQSVRKCFFVILAQLKKMKEASVEQLIELGIPINSASALKEKLDK